MNLTAISLFILDVDGVLTDGRLVSRETGEPAKAFFVQDGCAIKRWQRAGGKVAILSGRAETAVQRRAEELGIECLRTGVSDKLAGYEAILAETNRSDEAVAYVGDDLPDIPPMRRCAFPVAVADASPTVKRAAAYVTRRDGGKGAVAEVMELILRKRGQWTNDPT